MNDKILRGGSVVCDARCRDGAVISDGAVAVHGDTITHVGPFAQIRARFMHAEVIGTTQHVVLPGLINTHHHGWGVTPFQLGAKDELLESWILQFVRAMRPLDPYLDTLWADLQNIRSGVTTVLHAGVGREWGAYEAEVREKLRAHADSGIRAAYALHVRDQNSFVYEDDEKFLSSLPPGLARRLRALVSELAPLSVDGIFSLLERLVEEYDGHPRLSIMICPIGPQWCSDDLLRRVRVAANDLGVLIHLHCLESPYQREYGHRAYGTGTIRHLYDLDFLDSTVSLGHAVWLSDEEIGICAATGTSVCHNASSNLRLRVGILPLPRLLDEGVNVSIGMDGTALNDDEDMLQELRLIAKVHGLPQALPLPVPSSLDVLRMATANGATTLGLDSTIGVIQPGKKADAVLVKTDRIVRPYLHPDTDPIDAILYRASGVDVDTVVIAGDIVLRDGQFTRVDADAILSRLTEAASIGPPDVYARWFRALEEVEPFVRAFWRDWPSPPGNPYYRTNLPT